MTGREFPRRNVESCSCAAPDWTPPASPVLASASRSSVTSRRSMAAASVSRKAKTSAGCWRGLAFPPARCRRRPFVEKAVAQGRSADRVGLNRFWVGEFPMRFRYLAVAGLLATAAPAVLLAAGPRYGTWGAALEDMDTKVKPGDSMFDYAEGTWVKVHPIPADKTGAGYNYELPDEIEQQVKKMVEDVTTSPTSPIAQKIGDAYAAWMDEAGIERRGLEPAKPWLAKIDAVKTKSQLVRLMSDPGYAAPIYVGISADQDNPTRYTAVAGQARLGLPTRD